MRGGFVLLLAAILAIGPVLGGGVRQAALAQDGTPEALTAISITLDAVDFAYEGPSEVPAGYVTVTMTNNGAEPHHAQLVKLNEGVTMEQFQEAGQSPDPGALFALISFAGGPATVGPGGSSTVILPLTAGQYVVLCFIAGDDGVPHLAKGMVFPLTVTGDAAAAPEPNAASEVVTLDYSFELPASIAAGQNVWKITNQGQEPHEIAVWKLAPGVTADQVIAMVTAPAESTPEGEMAGMDMASPDAESGMAGPPFTDAGGMQALSTGLSGWAVLDLEPGEYIAVCFVPTAEGIPHAMLGMIQGFTVQ